MTLLNLLYAVWLAVFLYLILSVVKTAIELRDQNKRRKEPSTPRKINER